MPGKMNWEAIVEKQPGVWSDGEATWKKKRFRAQKETEDVGEKIWEDGEGRKRDLRDGYLFSKREKRKKNKSRNGSSEERLKSETKLKEKGFCKKSRVKEMFLEIKQ